MAASECTGQIPALIDLRNFIANYVPAPGRLIDNNGLIIIPVVVHILHPNEPLGVGFNISLLRIQNQLDVVNKDLRRLNSDRTNTPATFSSIASDFNIELRLACIDPNGNSTTGVVRKSTSKAYFNPQYRADFSFNDEAMGIKTANTGDAPWDPSRYLNIWVCNLRLVQGFATWPADYSKYPQFDGIVIATAAFNAITTTSGRILTHELGYWLDLSHLEGDNPNQDCGTDRVADTPPQKKSTNVMGCPAFPLLAERCNTSDISTMYMNFMSFAFQNCRNLFTNGQRAITRALFATSLGRSAQLNGFFGFTNQPTSITCTGSLIVTPLCLPVTWTISGPATITSGQNSNRIQLQATGNGTVNITAAYGNYIATTTLNVSIQSPPSIGDTYQINGQQQPMRVWFGNPATDYNNACNLQTTVTNMQISGATSVTWSKVTSSANISWSQVGNNLSFYFWGIGQTALFQVSATNTCGTSTYTFGFKSIDCSGGGDPCNSYQVSPNPATSSANVIVTNIPLPCDAATQSASKSATPTQLTITEIKIYDNAGNLKLIQKENKAKQAKVNLTGFKTGVYIIEVTDGKYREKQQIIVGEQ